MSLPVDNPPSDSPLALFVRWFDEATAAGLAQPEAMALATATPQGRPSVRMVLYRGLSGEGIRFFTNKQSRKGEELAANPFAATVFHWEPLGRQVRFEGRITALTQQEDDAYFGARPRGHQLAAVASPQSRPIATDALVARYHDLERQYLGAPVPRPAHWGGFRLSPDRIEFWTQKDNRLHERQIFVLEAGVWRGDTLAP